LRGRPENDRMTDVMKPINQKIAFISQSLPVNAIWSNRRAMGYPLHYHPAFELHLIKKGEGVYSISGDLYKFCPGQLVTIRPNQVHSFIAYSENVPIEKFTVQFHAKAAKSARLAEIDRYFPPIVLLSSSQYRRMAAIIENIIEATRDNKIRMESSVRRWLAELIKMVAGLKRRDANPHAENLLHAQLVRYIDQFYANPNCNATDIANRFGYSLNYLSSFFKKATGIGMAQYIIQCKIKAASSILSDKPAIKIVSVAAQVGFHSYRHFVRTFLRHTGFLPSNYRKKCHARSKK